MNLKTLMMSIFLTAPVGTSADPLIDLIKSMDGLDRERTVLHQVEVVKFDSWEYYVIIQNQKILATIDSDKDNLLVICPNSFLEYGKKEPCIINAKAEYKIDSGFLGVKYKIDLWDISPALDLGG